MVAVTTDTMTLRSRTVLPEVFAKIDPNPINRNLGPSPYE